jgi:hypothetical protein
MKYPKLKEIPTARELIDVFKGYNHNPRIGDGEFYDMKNLSSANFPILSTRPKRSIYATPTTPQGMIAKDALCYVDGADFVIKEQRVPNEQRVPMGLTVDNNQKTLISMGAYVIIMPDKKYINTACITDYGPIEAEVKTEGTVTFSLCKMDGVGYENVAIDEPTNPKNMDLWIDTSSEPHTLKQYSSTSAMWTTIATTYVKISSPGIGNHFEVNDGVTIEGVKSEDLADLNASMVIWAKGDDYIVVTGIIDKVITQNEPITITRKMPNMDFIIESENRLWGCRYGVALNGEIVNEIYASKLGDFKNWNCFMGISTDSYAATVGTDGQFTGAITHLGYPLFFKENYLHKVYGNYPSNYHIQTTACRGVQKGCERSLSIVNEVLYYKSRSGICAYDGSLPMEISSALGDVQYYNAVAGTLGNKYYISMKDDPNDNRGWNLFVYDTLKGMWHREDDTQAVAFCNCRGDLYYIESGDGHGQTPIKTVRGTQGNLEEEPIKWEAVTGIIGTDSPDKKYISRMDIRMSLEVGSRVSLFAEYDSSGEWQHLFSIDGAKLQTFAVPIRPQRCDHLRLKIVGSGEAKIFSICKTIEEGSDV